MTLRLTEVAGNDRVECVRGRIGGRIFLQRVLRYPSMLAS